MSDRMTYEGSWQQEIERLRAELKRKDRALLSAKYDAERVEYYRNVLCVDNGKWVCLPRTGAAATAIDPEKLGDILEERESLRAEVAEKDKRIEELEAVARAVTVSFHSGGERGHWITNKQIDKAWDFANKIGPRVRPSLLHMLHTFFNIVTCEECGGSGALQQFMVEPPVNQGECSSCHGHGWRKAGKPGDRET